MSNVKKTTRWQKNTKQIHIWRYCVAVWLDEESERVMGGLVRCFYGPAISKLKHYTTNKSCQTSQHALFVHYYIVVRSFYSLCAAPSPLRACARFLVWYSHFIRFLFAFCFLIEKWNGICCCSCSCFCWRTTKNIVTLKLNIKYSMNFASEWKLVGKRNQVKDNRYRKANICTNTERILWKYEFIVSVVNQNTQWHC